MDYTYLISNLPGDRFDGQSSDHLDAIIRLNLPNAELVGITSDSQSGTVVVSFNTTLSDADKLVLDALVARCNDSFIVTADNGVTDVGEPGEVQLTAGPSSSATITLQYKDGLGANSNGFGEAVKLTPAALMPIDKIGGNFDGTGKFSFVVGASLSRGAVTIEVAADSLPVRHLTVRWA